MIYLLTILITLSAVMYSTYQFEDVKAGWLNAKGKWHPYGMIMRVTPFLIPFFPCSWQDVLLSFAICCIIYEIGINVIALKEPPFYTGSNSGLDKHIGKFKWLGLLILLITAIVFKIK